MNLKIKRFKQVFKKFWFYYLIALSIVLGFSIGLGLGIGGLWLSPLAWVASAFFAAILLDLSYSKVSKKSFKRLCVYFLLCFLLVMPVFAASSIITNQSVAQSLSATGEINYFKNLLGRSYNYTELIQWEDSALHWNNSSSMIAYTDPVKIYEYHQARCGGYAILYAELCISQGYQARIVVSILDDHEWDEVKLNGTWTRVDPSPTGAPMSENIGYPLFYEEKWGTPPILALAFENSTILDVTSNYRSDNWSLLSGITFAFVFLGFWFSMCLLLIWKSIRRGRLGI
jgi:hypothetical protein